MRKIKAVFIFFYCCLFSLSLFAESNDDLFLIVTEPYPPFIFDDNSKQKGLDYEVTLEVLKLMGIKAEIKFFPWKRCIVMMQNKTADAILDLTDTDERKKFLFFPEEPLSYSAVGVFYNIERKPEITVLEDLLKYRLGTQFGYNYSQEVLDFIKHREDVESFEQNLQKLIADRIDISLESKAVGLYKILQAGYENKIGVMTLPGDVISWNYLGFAKKVGYDSLALKFGKKLKAFKQTQRYKDIAASYGQ